MSTKSSGLLVDGVDVSRETLFHLEHYATLLKKWTPRINLISSSTIDEIWNRHFVDSAQVWSLGPKRGHWVDLGSGGGFPGLVIAVLARETRDVSVTLVEADQRKATFLRTVIRELRLPTKVVVSRIEHANPLGADVITARALAPLSTLLGYTERHRRSDGRALFLKGEKAEAEIVAALENWNFDCQKHDSITDPRSSVLSIGEILRV